MKESADCHVGPLRWPYVMNVFARVTDSDLPFHANSYFSGFSGAQNLFGKTEPNRRRIHNMAQPSGKP